MRDPQRVRWGFYVLRAARTLQTYTTEIQGQSRVSQIHHHKSRPPFSHRAFFVIAKLQHNDFLKIISLMSYNKKY